jgi:hypothetical protein
VLVNLGPVLNMSRLLSVYVDKYRFISRLYRKYRASFSTHATPLSRPAYHYSMSNVDGFISRSSELNEWIFMSIGYHSE